MNLKLVSQNFPLAKTCTTCSEQGNGKARWYKLEKGDKEKCLECFPPESPASIIICLTPEQLSWAVGEGYARQARNVAAGNRSLRAMRDYSELEAHILGITGELAVAIYLGIDFNPGTEHDTEIGDLNGINGGIQVRTRGKPQYDMYLWMKDLPDFPYVLVTTTEKNGVRVIPQMRIVGWEWGWKVKSPQYWGRPRGTKVDAFWIPQKDLRPIHELK